MKKIWLFCVSAPMLCMFLVLGSTSPAKAQDISVSFQTFYDNLAPYGQWINDPQYGNVFVPNEDSDFRPYTRGYWAMTDYGNTWVSDDPWAWACYHYGRWTYNSYYGWIWIPGYDWAPAWVSWRYGRGYCGWAPLGPGYAMGDGYYCPDYWWVFVEPRYMYEPRWHDYYGGWNRNHYYLRHTEFMNNYDHGGHYGHYNYGPRAEVIERDTHRAVVVHRTNEVRESGAIRSDNQVIGVYRPNIERSSVNTARPMNVITAPRPIDGRGENRPRGQQNNNAVPGFRQEHPMPQANPQQHQPQPPVRQPEPVRQQPQPPVRQPEPVRQQPQPPVRQPEPVQHQEEPRNIPPVRQPEPVQHQQEPRNNPPVRQPEPVQHQQDPRANPPQQQMHNFPQPTQQPNIQPRPNNPGNPQQRPQIPRQQPTAQPHKEEKKK